jgi:hypothetical protein
LPSRLRASYRRQRRAALAAMVRRIVMRELAKSAFSFSWALSLLGVDQAINLVRPGHKSTSDVFEPITQVAVNQLDDSMRSMYRFGDNLQTRMFDMAFSWMNPSEMAKMSNWNPFRSTEKDCECSEKGDDDTAESKED